MVGRATCAARMVAAATGLCSGANSASASMPFKTWSSTRTAWRNLVPPCTTRCPTASTANPLPRSRGRVSEGAATPNFFRSDSTVRCNSFARVASVPSDTSAFAIAASSTLSTMLPFSELEPTFRMRTRTRLSSLGRWGRAGWGRSVGPGPVEHVRFVLAVIPGVLPVAEPLVHHVLADVRGARTESGNPVDHVDHQVESVQVIEHHHVEGRRGRALLFVSADVQVAVIRPPVGQTMDQPGISVIGEDHRPVRSEERVELGIGEAVRMLGFGLEFHQVYDVDNSNLQIGKVPA